MSRKAICYKAQFRKIEIFGSFRTKGLPIKGIKRTRLKESSDSEEETPKTDDYSCQHAGKKKKIGGDDGIHGEISIGEKAPCWWPSTSNASPGMPTPSSSSSTAMTELANLVNAHPRSARPLGAQAPEVCYQTFSLIFYLFHKIGKIIILSFKHLFLNE